MSSLERGETHEAKGMREELSSGHLQGIRLAEHILSQWILGYLSLVQITADVVHRYSGFLARGNIFAVRIDERVGRGTHTGWHRIW